MGYDFLISFIQERNCQDCLRIRDDQKTDLAKHLTVGIVTKTGAFNLTWKSKKKKKKII
jgi:hypothetical protein